jgi:elongation factor G
MTSRGDEVHGVLWFGIELTSERERAEIQKQLNTFIQAHPTFRIEVNAFENRLIVSGDDELELMGFREKILTQHEANIGELKISYKESIRRQAEAEGKYIRQTGGSGNYAHCKLRIEPNEPGAGYEFINDIKGALMPKEYIKPIDQGVQAALGLGILAGFPIVDVKVTLFDGSYHEVDSNEMAFKFAGSIAFKEAARKASPLLLEPVMAVEVTAPEELLGAMIGDINSRRGRIEGMELTAGTQVIRATIPLAEMLSSSRYGRPKYPMHFARYQPAPPRHEQFGDDAGTPVRKPSSPKPKMGSAAAELDG